VSTVFHYCTVHLAEYPIFDSDQLGGVESVVEYDLSYKKVDEQGVWEMRVDMGRM